ncbi:MAG: hypothetical protein ABIC95_07105 [archaeon]
MGIFGFGKKKEEFASSVSPVSREAEKDILNADLDTELPEIPTFDYEKPAEKPEPVRLDTIDESIEGSETSAYHISDAHEEEEGEQYERISAPADEGSEEPEEIRPPEDPVEEVVTEEKEDSLLEDESEEPAPGPSVEDDSHIVEISEEGQVEGTDDFLHDLEEAVEEEECDQGFLTTIYKRLAKNEQMTMDILDGIKGYWENRLKDFDDVSPDISGIQRRIIKKLEDLDVLEQEWAESKKELRKLSKEMEIVESEIHYRALELKDLMHREETLERQRNEREGKPDSVVRSAPGGRAFRLHDGRLVRTILELVDALRKMDREEFDTYCHDGGNHFATWIEHVFGHSELAERAKTTRSPEELSQEILKASAASL